MSLNSTNFEMRERRSHLVNFKGSVDADSKFIFAFAGRDELVRFCIHIGIHSNGHGRLETEFAGDVIDPLKFALAFDIERVNSLAKGISDFLTSLPYPSEGAAVRATARLQNAKQLTTGNDIKSRSDFCQQVEHGNIRICLHRVADQMV